MVLSFSKVIRTTGQTKARLLRVAASRAMNDERQAAAADRAANVVDAIRAGSIMTTATADHPMAAGHKPESRLVQSRGPLIDKKPRHVYDCVRRQAAVLATRHVSAQHPARPVPPQPERYLCKPTGVAAGARGSQSATGGIPVVRRDGPARPGLSERGSLERRESGPRDCRWCVGPEAAWVCALAIELGTHA